MDSTEEKHYTPNTFQQLPREKQMVDQSILHQLKKY